MKKVVLVNPYAKKQETRKETKLFDIFQGLSENDDGSSKPKDGNGTQQPSTKPASLSVSLPVWQRLPSKTLSFGSAEILTIPQACGVAPGRSIRVTGVLVHRSTTDTNDVHLVLGDPLAPIQRRVSILKPKSVLFDKTKKRKIVFRKKTDRRLSFASGLVKTAVDSSTVQLKDALSGDNRLWVIAPPETALQLQDSVTVMGEMEVRDERPCLMARIVRKSNGVHMKLYQDALQARQARLTAFRAENGHQEQRGS